jgi:glycosyltransferase involved in cell wall biosynthesis
MYLRDQEAPTVLVSLVVCTLGERRAQLERLLDSLGRQEFKSFEVILVDQNPSGLLDDIVQSRGRELSLKHVRSNRGLSLARNVGLRHASGEVVGFPDDDCWYLTDTLSLVADFFDRNPGIDILLGRTIDQFGSPSLSPTRKDSGAVNKRNIWTSGNSNTLFVRAGAIPDNGGFDEEIGVGASTRFQSGEETDFVLSLMENEARAVYSFDLKICHEQVEDVGVARTLRRAWNYSQGFGYVLRKHNFGRTYLAYRLARSIVRAGLAIIELQPIYGLSRLVWGAGTLVGYVAANSRG